MWELDHKEGWLLENWCFWNVVWEKTSKSPLDCKDIETVNPKGKQLCIFIGRIDAVAEVPILCPSDVKGQLTGKILMLGKIEGGKRGDNQGWDGWMASLTQWACVWISSRRWWRTGKPGMPQSMRSQRVRHELAGSHLISYSMMKSWKLSSKIR